MLAQQTIAGVRALLNQMQTQAESARQDWDREYAELKAEPGRRPPAAWIEQQRRTALRRGAELWRRHFESRIAAVRLTAVIRELGEAETRWAALAGDVNQTIDGWLAAAGSPENPPAASPSGFPAAAIASFLQRQQGELAQRVDMQLHCGILARAGGLTAAASDLLTWGGPLAESLRAACNTVLTAALNAITLQTLRETSGAADETLKGWVAEQLHQARPRAVDHGGQIRALIAHSAAAGEGERLNEFAAGQNPQPTCIATPAGNWFFCQELQKVPLVNVVYRMMERRADALDFVTRLHTRNDIDWTSLHDLFHEV